MWWNKFERDLSWAFSVIDLHERRQVYSPEQKLRLVLPKITASFLESQLAAMKIQLNQIPIGITYKEAMRLIRTEVHQKFPQTANFVLSQRDRRQLQETQQHGGRGRGGRGRGNDRHYDRNQYGGRGGGRGRGRGRGSQQQSNIGRYTYD